MSLIASVLVTHAAFAVYTAEEAPAPVIAPPPVVAGIAAAVFVLLGFVVWSYRDVANRHSDRVKPGSHDSNGSGGHGTGSH